MIKKDIGKVLTMGSLKQRLLLIAEDIARGKYFQEKLLTDQEFKQLSESFKKPNEIKLYNDFYKMDETVTNAIINLQGLLFEVKMHYSNLRGYILVWNSIENAELLVNSVLHEIKDHQERKRIVNNKVKKGVHLLFSKIEPDQEGYIEIKVDFEKNTRMDENKSQTTKQRKNKEYSLWYVMNNVKKEVEASVIKYLSWERALLDYMDENGFNVKTYKESINKMTTQVYTPIIGWAKYSGEINTGMFNLGRDNPRLKKTIEKYAICPNIEELKVDEAQYNWFRKYFLDDKNDYLDELRGKVNKKLYND